MTSKGVDARGPSWAAASGPGPVESPCYPHLHRRPSSTHRELWFSLPWGYCSFPLSPGVHKILLVSPKTAVSVSPGFPHNSFGKESACNAGDPGLIPGSRRSAGEGIGYPLHCSWASLLAQLAKNLPAMWESWVQSLGWEDPLEKGKAIHSSTLAWRIPWTE